jgi:photosystem II stability/assembly factor-like uncharacterized protein
MKAGCILRRTALAFGTAAALWLQAPPAHANGRMPGATELTISRSDPDHVLARATFGLIQSFDRGETWEWICEQAVNVSGETDPPIALTEDGSLVLLPPAGGTLISRDRGCTWSPAPAPLDASRAIDLTLDPVDPARVVVATSTIDTIDGAGLVAYTNTLVETRDNAATWTLLATLPADFKIETLEIAPSDAARIYVSGTASESPLIGVIERSEDGGQTWTRTTLDLPPSSGSLFISAIDPTDPDRLWVRLPALGDRFGLFPASLLASSDKGASFVMLAATMMGMLGLAVSPDGTQLAYGGPADGLHVGPSDGSGELTRVSDLRVRCLRWNADGLYACGTEPSDPFSVGLSTDQGATFQPVYTMAETCPQACADGTSFALACETPWTGIGPAIEASGETCSVPWARPEPVPDAGSDDAGARDAGTDMDGGAEVGTGRDGGAVAPGADAAETPGSERRDEGCSCAVAGNCTSSAVPWIALVVLVLAVRLHRLHRIRRSR